MYDHLNISQIAQFNIIMCVWCTSHIGIKGNELADTIEKEALNHCISEFKITYTDLKWKIKELYITNGMILEWGDQ